MTAIRYLCAAAMLVCFSPGVASADPQPPAIATEAATAAKPATPEKSPALVAAKPAPAIVPAVTLHAKADLTQQTLTVSERGRVVGVWKISSGVQDHATPRGLFQPEWTAKMWYSRTYDNAPMPHAVFFKSGAAIHATQSIGALGRAASHGCVRLAPANAETFYKLVQKHGLVHTRIAVFGTPNFARPAHRSIPVASRVPNVVAAAQHRPQNSLGYMRPSVRVAYVMPPTIFSPTPKIFYQPVRLP